MFVATSVNAASVDTTANSLTARSAIVIDKQTGETVFAQNENEARSLASLTKLMSVLVFLDNNPGWSKVVTLRKTDFVGGACLYARVGDKIKVKDAFYGALVGSKNNLIEALVRSTGLSQADFVALMNERALEWGLENTKFVEPTGLDERNVSTAREMAVIAQKAFGNMDVLKATTTKSYRLTLVNRKASFVVDNTNNKILNRDLCVTGTKTGWTSEAGYNLVTQAKTGEHELIALVMGAKITRNYEEVYALLKEHL
ncbi:MAG: serine hydrolase [Parcubacteria group bacterium]